MPFTFLSHQAVVLPLKLARPRRFSGTALVVGSMAPDFEYFLRGEPIAWLGHGTPWAALWGPFLLTVPATLAVVWLVRRVIAAPLAAHLPDLGPFRLRDYAALAAPEPPGYWRVAAWSALLGVLSHILWDGVTHWWGVFGQTIEPLRTATIAVGGRRVALTAFLWALSTVAGAAVTVALLHRIGTRRLMLAWAGASAPAPASGAARRRFWLRLALLCALGFALSIPLRDYRPAPTFHPPDWVPIALRTAAFAFIALVASSWAERWRAGGRA